MSRADCQKKDLYVAKLIKEGLDDYGMNIPEYAKPKYYGKFNIQPLSGESDIAEYGSRVSKMQRMLVDYDKYLNVFKEGDVAYLDRVTPKEEEVFGDKANYRISSIREQHRKIAIYFEKIE